MRVRFIRDIAFLKGDKLSGMLEGVIFKITICDEGTIDFEEVDTNISDKAIETKTTTSTQMMLLVIHKVYCRKS
jgi:hypothetical protein